MGARETVGSTPIRCRRSAGEARQSNRTPTERERRHMKLAGKVALVTGAQQGIGAAIAVALAEDGADVTITWLDDQLAAEAVAGRIRQAGRRVHLTRADVARLAGIESMIADTVRVLGAPDILVNNAGVYPR